MGSHCCKIGSVITEYELTHGIGGGDINEYLIARWLGKNEYPEDGVRPLTDWFNKQLIKTVYENHNRRVIDSRIDLEYDILTGDDESEKVALIQDLETDDIDGEELTDNFVSTTTMYRHLKKCLEAEKERKQADPESNWEEKKIGYIKNTVEGNVRDILRSLDNKGRVEGGKEAEIDLDIILACPDCDTEARLEKVLKQGYICRTHAEDSSDTTKETSDTSHTKNKTPI